MPNYYLIWSWNLFTYYLSIEYFSRIEPVLNCVQIKIKYRIELRVLRVDHNSSCAHNVGHHQLGVVIMSPHTSLYSMSNQYSHHNMIIPLLNFSFLTLLFFMLHHQNACHCLFSLFGIKYNTEVSLYHTLARAGIHIFN